MARGPEATLDAVFMRGLRDLGYEEGKNILIERRYTYNKPGALPVMAAELASMHLDLIVTAPHDATVAMKQAAGTTPIVMATGVDPVGAGLVANLARPGGNVTGMTNVATDLVGKEFELLKELVPGTTRIALLANAATPVLDIYLSQSRAAAQALGLQLQVVPIRGPDKLEQGFETLAQGRPGGVFVMVDSMLLAQRERIAQLAAQHRIPTITAWRQYPVGGGLIAYGPKLSDNFYRAATYVDKILKGARPADLPVQQPTRYELVINMKTAKALGITIPPSILIRADEVIR